MALMAGNEFSVESSAQASMGAQNGYSSIAAATWRQRTASLEDEVRAKTEWVKRLHQRELWLNAQLRRQGEANALPMETMLGDVVALCEALQPSVGPGSLSCLEDLKAAKARAGPTWRVLDQTMPSHSSGVSEAGGVAGGHGSLPASGASLGATMYRGYPSPAAAPAAYSPEKQGVSSCGLDSPLFGSSRRILSPRGNASDPLQPSGIGVAHPFDRLPATSVPASASFRRDSLPRPTPANRGMRDGVLDASQQERTARLPAPVPSSPLGLAMPGPLNTPDGTDEMQGRELLAKAWAQITWLQDGCKGTGPLESR